MTLFLTARSPKITVCRKIGVTKGATRVIRSIFGEPERLNPTDSVHVEGGGGVGGGDDNRDRMSLLLPDTEVNRRE